MIILVHDTKVVISCQKDAKVLSTYHQKPVVKAFLNLAKTYTDELLIWVHQDYQQDLNHQALEQIFHHKRIMASYTTDQYLPEAIGYVEQSPFINVNLKVKYPTWRMHQNVGGINTSAIQAFADYLPQTSNLNLCLHHLAKLAQPQGLLCYSHPELLKLHTELKTLTHQQANISQVFAFAAQHYKWIWKYLLALNLFIYESKIPLLAWLKSCFKVQIKPKAFVLKSLPLPKLKPIKACEVDLDVIIPTIGRKAYLHDVLKDLAQQSILPQRIIIVEQNPDANSKSELNYLIKDTWPFEIVHKFIHQTGVCNARNLALDLVKAKWVFLADDDNRLSKFTIENIFRQLNSLKVNCLTTAYLQKGDKNPNKYLSQTTIFGSGNSFVNNKLLKKHNIKFDKAYEFNYGEDSDFGLQLRQKGIDVIITQEPSILHLKAPVGGFRTKFVNPWDNESIKPKPSPTIMFLKLKYKTQEQILGYKTTLFFKVIKSMDFKLIKNFNVRWQVSVHWAKQLLNA